MSWAKVKKINSNLSTPLDYLVHLQDVRLNQYDSYVFRDESILRTLAINTTEIYDVLNNLIQIRTKLGSNIWKEVILNNKNLGYILNMLINSEYFPVIPNGSIDDILGRFSASIHNCIDEKDMLEIITYINNKLDSEQVGKWINEVFQLNSSDIDSCTSISEVVSCGDVELLLSNLHACYILTMSNYSEVIIDVQQVRSIIRESIKSSSNMLESVEIISGNNYLLNIALTDKDIADYIFNSIDNIRIIMSKQAIVDKIKNDKEILSTIFDNYQDFVLNFVLKQNPDYYQRKINTFNSNIDNNTSCITNTIDGPYFSNLHDSLISYSNSKSHLLDIENYENYLNKTDKIKLDMKLTYLAVINSMSLLNSKHLDIAVIKSKYSREYLGYDIIYNLVLSENDNLPEKLRGDVSLLESLVKIDTNMIGNELSNYEKYGLLLEVQTSKKLLQSYSNVFYPLVKDEKWFLGLMFDQSDYTFVLDSKSYRSAIWYSEKAMSIIAVTSRFMNYLTHCSQTTMIYFKGSSEIYDRSMPSAKMLMGLSGQDSSIVESLNDITIQQLKEIIDTYISLDFSCRYSEYIISQLLLRNNIYNYLFDDKEGHKHFAKIIDYRVEYILGNEEYALIICNKSDLFKEVIRVCYSRLWLAPNIFFSIFSSSNIACSAFWEIAKSDLYEPAKYLIDDLETMTIVLKNGNNFMERLIEVMDYLSREIYKSIYNSKPLFNYICNNVKILNRFLKHNIAKDVLITECNEILQNYSQKIYKTISLNNDDSYFIKSTSYSKNIESFGIYNDTYNDRIYFSRIGITSGESTFGAIVVHGYKLDASKINHNGLPDSSEGVNYMAYRNDWYESAESYKISLDGGYFYSSYGQVTVDVVGYRII